MLIYAMILTIDNNSVPTPTIGYKTMSRNKTGYYHYLENGKEVVKCLTMETHLQTQTINNRKKSHGLKCSGAKIMEPGILLYFNAISTLITVDLRHFNVCASRVFLSLNNSEMFRGFINRSYCFYQVTNLTSLILKKI